MKKNQIIDNIMNYIKDNGGINKTNEQWYVGISENATASLFIDHNSDIKNRTCIFEVAESNKKAREIEEFFINTLKTDGGSEGGNHNAIMVYAYKKTPTTKP